MVLYRPVGEEERALIEERGWEAFPPRLPEQPIFYPVLNQRYAAEIAGRWNARAGSRGYVTRFEVEDGFLARYEVHTVGREYHQEFWVPAEDLEALNRHILGKIEVIQTLEPPDQSSPR